MTLPIDVATAKCGRCNVRMTRVGDGPAESVRALLDRPEEPSRARAHPSVIARREGTYTPSWQRAEVPLESPEAVPAGIPAAVKVVVAADMLGLSPATVRGWIDRETIDFRQDGRGRLRYVPTRELLRKANALGLEVDWERALE